MRVKWVIISGLILSGCVSQKPQPSNPASQPVVAVASRSSAALVFDPPLTLAMPPIDLSRDTRGEAAFAGFQDSTTTYFYVHTYDRQTTDDTDRYVREARIAQVGVNRR